MGAKRKVKCIACLELVSRHAKFCPNCGERLSDSGVVAVSRRGEVTRIQRGKERTSPVGVVELGIEDERVAGAIE